MTTEALEGFTATDYLNLSPREQAAIRAVGAWIGWRHDDFLGAPEAQMTQHFHDTFDLLATEAHASSYGTDRETRYAIPDQYTFDRGPFPAVQEKFGAVFRAASVLAKASFGDPNWPHWNADTAATDYDSPVNFEVVVDPSVDNLATVVVYERIRMEMVYVFHLKPYNFHFESLEELAQEVTGIADTLEEAIRGTIDREDQRSDVEALARSIRDDLRDLNRRVNSDEPVGLDQTTPLQQDVDTLCDIVLDEDTE